MGINQRQCGPLILVPIEPWEMHAANVDDGELKVEVTVGYEGCKVWVYRE